MDRMFWEPKLASGPNGGARIWIPKHRGSDGQGKARISSGGQDAPGYLHSKTQEIVPVGPSARVDKQATGSQETGHIYDASGLTPEQGGD